jgi:arylsulfatase A-like enzyme
MAAAGVRLTRYYAAAPVCSPTRGSCLTGRHPSRYGIPGANRGHLRAEEWNLAELFHAAGHATGHFGKWHLGTMTADFSGKGPGRQPARNHMSPGMAGFDRWFSTEFSVATYEPYAPENAHCAAAREGDPRALFWLDGEPFTERPSGCTSKLVMDHALEFIRAAVSREQRFLAVVWFHAPHEPVVGHPRYMAELYADRPEEERHYYSVVTALDAQMGRLRRELRELGVAEDTLVWFASDNGPEGNPGPRERSRGSSGPFRGRKRSLYEGGVRVPSVVEWPGRLEPGVVDAPVVSSDVLPTLAALLGAPLPERPYDGIDAWPLLTRERERRGAPIGFAYASQRSLVGDTWKLVLNARAERLRSDDGQAPVAALELYDLARDPAETRNLADEEPERAAGLRAELEAWERSCAASGAGADYGG